MIPKHNTYVLIPHSNYYGDNRHPQEIYKPHYQKFSPLANGLYLISTTNKTPLRNGNCAITDPITEMGVAHTVGHNAPSDLQTPLPLPEFFPIGQRGLPYSNY